ncbi:uncharacterized protein HMPREF1541_00846 [Cyphellophora europaea CBS 101466]|uniref:Uncharacterized protein n=1 Tax=Cyphellophora europaea (strain CBS 101466) TaxID=1220924 RepID=W2SDF6_CYPE1|nr:uncharacterized protein HMPREF1541_00846 [Cyphellophora europaea CBS 101466]ETN46660.1 hypothetical protein HMPREF1541_00846 [Cyphellophora europaea CBS 101466]
MVYQPNIPPFATRPRMQHAWVPGLTSLAHHLSSNFDLSTLLLVGASLQSLLVLALRSKYAFLPSFLILLFRITDALLITFRFKPNPYLQDAFIGRRTALLPDADGQITGPGKRKVVILLLGAKSNHPLGIFAPEFKKMGGFLSRMNKLFDSPDAPEGLLGQTSFDRRDERGAREFVFISYWNSIQDLHAFAHTGLHRETWLWWEKDLKQRDYVGINHEIYEAEARAWENVYVNFQPTGLGATTFLKRGDKVLGGVVQHEFIHPLVDARRGKLAKSSGRLGWDATQHDRERPAAEAYGTDDA